METKIEMLERKVKLYQDKLDPMTVDEIEAGFVENVIAVIPNIDEQGIEIGITEDEGTYEVCHRIVAKDGSVSDWISFGGTVGYGVAEFSTLNDAINYIVRGVKEQKNNPEIWLDMLKGVIV